MTTLSSVANVLNIFQLIYLDSRTQEIIGAIISVLLVGISTVVFSRMLIAMIMRTYLRSRTMRALSVASLLRKMGKD